MKPSDSAEVDEKAGSAGLNPSDAAESDKTVGDSALVAEVGSDDAEDADSLDFDDMDSGELTDMENTGGLVYREKFMATPRDSDDTLACIFFCYPSPKSIAFGKTQKSPFCESESGHSIEKG